MLASKFQKKIKQLKNKKSVKKIERKYQITKISKHFREQEKYDRQLF